MTQRKKEFFIYPFFFILVYFALAFIPSHSFALQDNSSPPTEAELYQQCKTAYTKGDFVTARQSVDKFLSLYPQSQHIDEILFMEAFLQPDIEASMGGYRNIIEKYPDSKWIAKAHFQIGQCYYLRGEYDRSLDHYGRIIVSYSEDDVYWSARYWRCKAFMAKGEYKEAMAALRSLEESNPPGIGKDMIMMVQGNCYMGVQDYENARAAYNFIIESMPDSQWVPSAYLMLAESFQKTGNAEKAKESLQKLIEGYQKSMEAIQAKQILDPLSSEQASDKSNSVETQPAVSKTVSEPVKPAQETPAKSPSIQTGSYFSIQVGAFSSKSNADKLARQLRVKGYNNVAVLNPSPGEKKLYKVMVGKFKSQEDALKIARILSEKEKLRVVIVP